MVFDIMAAIFKLGAPMAIMSWWVYSWMYRTERLDPTGSRKEQDMRLKQMRKERKESRRNGSRAGSAGSTDPEDFWLQKWLWLGGGFYGMAALWTLLVVEILELVNFAIGLPQFISTFAGGPIDLLVGFFINQIQNLITAFVWVTYWGGGFSLVWIAVAYLGYLLGLELAKRSDAKLAWRNLIARWSS